MSFPGTPQFGRTLRPSNLGTDCKRKARVWAWRIESRRTRPRGWGATTSSPGSSSSALSILRLWLQWPSREARWFQISNPRRHLPSFRPHDRKEHCHHHRNFYLTKTTGDDEYFCSKNGQTTPSATRTERSSTFETTKQGESNQNGATTYWRQRWWGGTWNWGTIDRCRSTVSSWKAISIWHTQEIHFPWRRSKEGSYLIVALSLVYLVQFAFRYQQISIICIFIQLSVPVANISCDISFPIFPFLPLMY